MWMGISKWQMLPGAGGSAFEKCKQNGSRRQDSDHISSITTHYPYLPGMYLASIVTKATFLGVDLPRPEVR